MHNPLVSIITPCYNGESHVHRLLDSILIQTYKNIEFIFVNNGSTDKTEEIAISYEKKFEQAKISFIYLSQEKNNWAAGALNKGLRIFKGDYLMWPDADDILHKDNIKNKVEFLVKNINYAMVLCKTRMIDEISLKQIGILERKIPKKDDELFFDLIVEKNVYYAPGAYMVRASAFLEINPKREIYISPIGQNWQMLLPIAYTYKCGYLNEYLFDYMVRQNSQSRKSITKEQVLAKANADEEVIIHVLNEIDMKDREYFLDIVKKKYIRKRIYIAFLFKDKVLSTKEYKQLQYLHGVQRHDIMNYYCTRFISLRFIYKLINYFLHRGRKAISTIKILFNNK